MENKKVHKEGEGGDEERNEGTESCRYCGNHPCFVAELDEMLVSIVDTYSTFKSNKQIRFKMYSDSVRFIYGSSLGKGMRKKLPHCVQCRIRSLAPDESYTGYKDAKSNDND